MQIDLTYKNIVDTYILMMHSCCRSLKGVYDGH